MKEENKIVHGYKSFNIGGTNVAGLVMPVGKYHYDKDIIPTSQGFHFSAGLEDTLIFTDTDEPLIAEVIGSNNVIEIKNIYPNSGIAYVTSDIEIVRYLTRDEILNYAFKLDDKRLINFLDRYNLSKDELDIFRMKSENIKSYIDETIKRYGFIGRSKVLK